MPDKVVIPFTALERALLARFEAAADQGTGLRMADVVAEFEGGEPGYDAAAIKAALWRLMADRYLTMTPEREISRLFPEAGRG